MTNEDVLDLVRRCKLRGGVELSPNEAYLFQRKFRSNVNGRIYYEQEEVIVLVKNGIKVGGIYRMGPYDIHVVIKEEYRGKGILSGFLKKGIINEIWPENTSVKLCGVDTREEYNKKRYLVQLCNMTIRNEDEIERHLSILHQ